MGKHDRLLILNKFGGKCAYCGCDLKGKFQVDHIISQRNFYHCVMNKFKVPEFLKHLEPQDCNHIDNLVPACASCNNYKSANNLECFRSEVGKLIGRLNDRFNQYKIVKRYGLVEEVEKPVVFYFETFGNG